MRQRYVVAVKPNKRDKVQPDLATRLGSSLGITVTGATRSRAMIEAEPSARDQLERELGELVHIEPVIEHHTSKSVEDPAFR